ncbi:MAG TPA: ribosome maturation factor RimM [bacterium]|nr:ribosome maturation factor RimM [bacterium]
MLRRDDLTCIGRVTEPRGLHGELKVAPLTTAPAFYTGLADVILDSPRGLRAFAVEELREAPPHWVLRLKGVTDRGMAEALRGAQVLVPSAALKPLAEDEYFAHDLVGCRVETLAGVQVGTVSAVLETPANDMLEVEGGGREVLVPMVGAVVKEVDLRRRLIRIDPPPGLLELNG